MESRLEIVTPNVAVIINIKEEEEEECSLTNTEQDFVTIDSSVKMEPTSVMT